MWSHLWLQRKGFALSLTYYNTHSPSQKARPSDSLFLRAKLLYLVRLWKLPYLAYRTVRWSHRKINVGFVSRDISTTILKCRSSTLGVVVEGGGNETWRQMKRFRRQLRGNGSVCMHQRVPGNTYACACGCLSMHLLICVCVHVQSRVQSHGYVCFPV
jgi:hypothetical protein